MPGQLYAALASATAAFAVVTLLGILFFIGAVLAPVLILSTAPVSIGGFGVREGSFVLLLGYAGIGATNAAPYSLLVAAAFALASLPGAFALLHRPQRPASLES